MREARASGSASSTRMDPLAMLAGSSAGVSLAREISGGPLKPTGMAKVGWSERITGCSLEGGSSGWLSMVGGPSGWLSMVGGPLAGYQWRRDPGAGMEWWSSLVDLGWEKDPADGMHWTS